MKQSSAVHIPALYSADVILPGSSSKPRLLVINLALVPGRQLVNSPTAQSLERYVPYYEDPTMTELIPTINEIAKYGLQPNLTVTDKEKLLERDLVKIYNLYFDIKFDFDQTDYPDFDKANLPNIRQNIESNFKDFGFYKTILDINDIDNLQDSAIGDAVDDLNDIIIDLLEIKWRIENNSLANGLWFFELMFYGHIQQHLLDLLNYMKQKNG